MRPAKLGRLWPHRMPFRPLLWNAFRPCTGSAAAAADYSDAASDTDTIETSLFDTQSHTLQDDDVQNLSRSCPDSEETHTEISNNNISKHQRENSPENAHHIRRIVGARTITENSPIPAEHAQRTDNDFRLHNIGQISSTASVDPGAASPQTEQSESTCISRLDLCFNCRRNVRDYQPQTHSERTALNIESQGIGTACTGIETFSNDGPQLEVGEIVPEISADGASDAAANLYMTRSASSTSLYQCARCNKRFVNNNNPSPPLPLTLLYNSTESRNASWSSRNGSMNSRLFGSLPFRTSSQRSSSSNSLASWTSNINDGFLNAGLLRSDSAHGAVGASSTENSTSFNGLLFNFARQFQHSRNGTRWGIMSNVSDQSNSDQSSNHNSLNNSVRNTSTTMDEVRRLVNNPVNDEQRQWYFYDPRLTQFNRAQRLTLETNFAGIHNEMSMPGIISPPSYDEIQTLPTIPPDITWSSHPHGVYQENEPPPPYTEDPPPEYYSRSNSIRSSSGISQIEDEIVSDIDNNNDSASIISDIILENWAMLPQADDVADHPHEVIQSLLYELRQHSAPERAAEIGESSTDADHESDARNVEGTNVSDLNSLFPVQTQINDNTNVSTSANVEPNERNIHSQETTETDACIDAADTYSLVSNDSLQSNLLLRNDSSSGWPGMAAMDPDQFHFGPTVRMGMRPPIRWNRGRDVNRWTSAQGWLPQI